MEIRRCIESFFQEGAMEESIFMRQYYQHEAHLAVRTIFVSILLFALSTICSPWVSRYNYISGFFNQFLDVVEVEEEIFFLGTFEDSLWVVKCDFSGDLLEQRVYSNLDCCFPIQSDTSAGKIGIAGASLADFL